MDVATGLTLVRTFLQLLNSPISNEIESLWGYKSQLQKLRDTMSTIEVVLDNVERLQSQQLPISIPQVTLGRLQDAVYQVDDLLDEAATVSQLKQLMSGYKLTKEVRLFFSRFNHLHYVFTKSRQITKLRRILDGIAQDHRDFGAMIQPLNNVEVTNNINSSSRDTHSFLYQEDVIIGRDEDQWILMDMLLDTSVAENVLVVSIVGIGGLGKTTLAKLLYNDPHIQAEFDVKLWVCVSDDFDLRSLLGKILAAATHNTPDNGLSMEELHIRLQQLLYQKKYLLVLDDVWNEDDVMKWDELRNILMQGGRGSRIIVTTRSLRVAELAGSHLIHELQGLSVDDSWELFQEVTLMEPHLVKIGKEIVRKCFNVPLAIRFVGSLLQGQTERVWQSLMNTDLANIKQDDGNDHGIIPVLKISYNHLPQHLKSCFTYCAVYPKDYRIQKEDLINQWMAHGFIKSSSNNRSSLEDTGEEYFMKLLQRCFFQDVYQTKFGEILSCKMHDLVHDLAKVAGSGFVMANNDNCSWSVDKARHIFMGGPILRGKDVKCHLTNLNNLRTFLEPPQFMYRFPRNLRVLSLSGNMFCESTLPSTMSELLHLRYLDVSKNIDLVSLPNSITQLYNLQTLNLNHCCNLKELPRDFSRLVNLRHLDILHTGLRHMPRGMNRMTCLHKLTMFVVKKYTWSLWGQGDVGKLEDLKDLNSLRDHIQIVLRDGWQCDSEEVKEGGYLINKALLNRIAILWSYGEQSNDDAEASLQGLQPHPNIKELSLFNYPGVQFPRWGQSSMNLNMNTTLPNLVVIEISGGPRLERLPSFSQLHHLKLLILSKLSKVEYVESRNFRGEDEVVFFPSLEYLVLEELPELKGSLLVPEEEGRKRKQRDNDAWRCLGSTLRHLNLSYLPGIVKLPKGMQHLTALCYLRLDSCNNLEEIPRWIGCLVSLQCLQIIYCTRVRSLPGKMRNLTSLTELKLDVCSPELRERCRKPTGVDWPKIRHIPSISIRFLSSPYSFFSFNPLF